MNTYKQCPYCGEEILSVAIKCRYCGSMLTDTLGPVSNVDPFTFVKLALSNRYEIIEEIGQGGMATVYKAIQKNLERIVALKVIHQNLVHDKEFLERFHREAKISASLSHPNIVTIYDEGIEKGVHFMAMEYLEGIDLLKLIRRKGKLSEQDTIKIIIPIADALDYAHKRGLIHRDVKSANIIITTTGRPVLTDFGIAHAASGTKLTQTGTVIGTPEYMSPEQAEGKAIDSRSDLYSLGIVMYECLAGRVPYKGENPITTIYKIINEPLPKIAGISYWLETVINKQLSKHPDKRFKSGDLLKKVLEERKAVEVDRLYDESDNTRKIRVEKKHENERTINKPLERKEVVRPVEFSPQNKKEERITPSAKEKGSNNRIFIGLVSIIILVLVGYLIIILSSNTGVNPPTEKTEQNIQEENIPTKIEKIPDSDLNTNPMENKPINNSKTNEEKDKVFKEQDVLEDVPYVIGLDESEAKKILNKKGFSYRIIKEAGPSNDIGFVIRQSPSEGNRLKRGSVITITIGE